MKITIRHSVLPAVAREVFPTAASLAAGFEWYKAADQERREKFHQARLDLLKMVSPLTTAPSRQQCTSGTTGRRKIYRWGPNFEQVDRFFYSLVCDGDRLGKTASLEAFRIRDVGGENFIIKTIDNPGWYNFHKHIWIEVNGHGAIAGLRDELRGYNLFVPPSVFEMLEPQVSLTNDLDPDAMVIFTGEALSQKTWDYLKGKNIDVRDEMRCWDGGATFYTCRYGNRHWVDFLAPTWTDDEDRLLANDLFNLSQPFLEYHNGDKVIRTFGEMCPCGGRCCTNEFANRSLGHALKTPTGIVATYEMLFDIFLTHSGLGLDSIMAVCFGRYHDNLDYRIKITYLAHGNVNVEEIGQRMFDLLGVRVEFENGVTPTMYKLRKIYFVDE